MKIYLFSAIIFQREAILIYCFSVLEVSRTSIRKVVYQTNNVLLSPSLPSTAEFKLDELIILCCQIHNCAMQLSENGSGISVMQSRQENLTFSEFRGRITLKKVILQKWGTEYIDQGQISLSACMRSCILSPILPKINKQNGLLVK